ncbi:HAMP domain-containing sensor histidine kinase [Aquibacillus kalidii]|uniref:HAMP domain-containing sensor histidine kinase n=1 Tax=Aquibacillus kalidii TaxID=2762597 RepID=UPI00164412DE|nr:HAMP domain-containing sensor histidine kinase [Aquibacillus kalidii]
MRKVTKEKGKYSLFSFNNILIFFFLTFLVGSVNIALYVNIMDSYDILVEVFLFGNLLFISIIFSVFDAVRRKFTIEKPVRKILGAVEKISKGEFGTQVATHHTKRMNEFDEIIAGINKMSDELAKVETLKTDFISNVTHEIKTPLAIIQNYATLQQNESLSDENRIEYAQTISDATKRLSGLVTNILKLNKLENQEIYPKVEEYNISEQLRRSLLSYEEVWNEKNLNITADIEDAIVSCDENLLEIVWNNLISNAIKFTDPGGEITITLKNKIDSIEVKVQDTGCGIDKTTGLHIFDKFYQGDTSHAKEGNGLGLAMVKRVVDILAGDISVESRLGIGSTFIVEIKK